MPARYAVYAVPEPGTPLAELGSALLGRDSETGAPVAQPRLPDFSPEHLAELTADARRYGLHATIKAPFYLKPGMAEAELLGAAARFAPGRPPILVHRLLVTGDASFSALAPAGETDAERQALHRLNAFADNVVLFFDGFRAPPTPEEIRRRKPEELTPRRRELLAQWGYPFVFEEFRFHITLAGRAHDAEEARALRLAMQEYLQPALDEPIRIADICVCRQDERGDFILLERFRF